MAKKDTYWRMLIAAGLVLAALPYGGCAGRDPVDDAVDPGGSLVSEEGRIAFTHAATLDWSDPASSESDVHAIDVDGSGESRLTDSPGLDGFPTWSPDGESIAYGTDPRSLAAIWVMNADGSDRERLATGLFPTWSPDGKRIAYTAYSGERPYIAVMDADHSSGRRSLGASLIERLTGRVYDEEPAWSPDGERIAFASYAEKDNEEIFVMNADGSGLMNLTDVPAAEDFYPAWRP